VIDLSKLLDGKIKLLGLELDLGNVNTEKLGELREKLKQAGAPEILDNESWLGGAHSIRTGKDIKHIPPTAGFTRGSTRSPRPTPAGHTVRRMAKASEPSSQIKVEPDTAFDEEFQLIPELTKVLEECLVAFPEVKDVEIRATHSNELSGCKGTHKGKPLIILFVPDKVWGQWLALKPIVYHELSHFLGKDSEETERIFFERADEKSKKHWKKLKEVGALECNVKED